MTLASTAAHEAAHAVAIIRAFREAQWLARRRPLLPVSWVEIYDDNSGNCHGLNIYSRTWPEQERLTPRYRPLMEMQIGIHLAGACGEGIERGVLRWDDVQDWASTDLRKARAVGDDLHRVSGIAYNEQQWFTRTHVMLQGRWRCVDALVRELVRRRRLDGCEVMAIVDGA